jgi:hypothetical protein
MGWDNASFEHSDSAAEIHDCNSGICLPEVRYTSDDAWLEDRKRLKPSALGVFTEHPLATLVLVLLFGVLVFGRVLP